MEFKEMIRDFINKNGIETTADDVRNVLTALNHHKKREQAESGETSAEFKRLEQSILSIIENGRTETNEEEALEALSEYSDSY